MLCCRFRDRRYYCHRRAPVAFPSPLTNRVTHASYLRKLTNRRLSRICDHRQKLQPRRCGVLQVKIEFPPQPLTFLSLLVSVCVCCRFGDSFAAAASISGDVVVCMTPLHVAGAVEFALSNDGTTFSASSVSKFSPTPCGSQSVFSAFPGVGRGEQGWAGVGSFKTWFVLSVCRLSLSFRAQTTGPNDELKGQADSEPNMTVSCVVTLS